MKTVLLAAAMTLFLTFYGCSGDPAESLFETAELEELQENKEHAQKLYREIIETYPDSPYAQIARSRLSPMK